MSQLRDGYVLDLATKKPVDLRKPEETVRQEYERILHEDYGYAFSQMDIEVAIQRGSSKKPRGTRDFADIVVYKTADASRRTQHKDIWGIVENQTP